MPMPASEIERLIKAVIPDAEVTIRDLAGDGDHYAARVVSQSFAGLSRIKQHQAVYAALGGRVGGELHALQLETAVPDTETTSERPNRPHRRSRQEGRYRAVHEGHRALPPMRLLKPRDRNPRPSWREI